MYEIPHQQVEAVQACVAFDWSRYEPAITALWQQWDHWAASPWDPEEWVARLWPDAATTTESFRAFAAVLTEFWSPYHDESLFTAGIRQLLTDIYQPAPAVPVQPGPVMDDGGAVAMGSLFDDFDDDARMGSLFDDGPGVSGPAAPPAPVATTSTAPAPTVFGGRAFTAGEEELIAAARDLAQTHAKAALEVITRPGGFEDAIAEFFGGAWASADDVISCTYRAVVAQAAHARIHMYGSGGNEKLTSSMADGSAFAYTEVGNAIFLAERFWELDPDQQGFCILHELSHFVDSNILDRSTFFEKTGLGTTYGFECATNAYSYQYFAEAVASARPHRSSARPVHRS
ncbi:hypothetical protein [Streptomyces sp. NPDC057301]|uniref:hypothetical protein n=1 Tax=Streptomyces sp. NPDC057301 TaxID=3346093 RepID=UPI003643B82A